MKQWRNGLVFVVILILDQLTKYLAISRLEFGKQIEVLPGLFNLTLVYNPGAAFGIFSDMPDTLRRVTLAVVSLIALAVIARLFIKEAREDWLAQTALAAILAGAVGNIIDRFRYDAVVDFLDFYWQEYHWPAFNVADSAISVGVVAVLFKMLVLDYKRDKK